jgi:hypothetical protein
MVQHNITPQYCDRDDKECLGLAERFNRTIKLMIEKYLTRMNTNRWIENIKDCPPRETFEKMEVRVWSKLGLLVVNTGTYHS